MKTSNHIKAKTMKNKFLVLVLAVVLLPFAGWAQNDIFEKYNGNTDVSYVSIKPKMFEMIAKMGINVDDPEAEAYMDMVKSITSFKVLKTANKNVVSDISKWVSKYSRGLEELMEVKNEGTEVKFYVKEGKDSDHVKELLIFVNGVGKALESQGVEVSGDLGDIETVVVSLTGDINLNQISKLTDKMNIPAGKHLEKSK